MPWAHPGDHAKRTPPATQLIGSTPSPRLKEEASPDAYPQVPQNARDRMYPVEQDGKLKADYTYWKGFAKRTVHGLCLEHRQPRP